MTISRSHYDNLARFFAAANWRRELHQQFGTK